MKKNSVERSLDCAGTHVQAQLASSSSLVELLTVELGRVCHHHGGRQKPLAARKELVAQALNLDRVVRHGEDDGLDLACLGLLVHVLDEVSFALNAAIGDLTDLLRVEGLPCLVVQVQIEWYDVNRVYEVDEGITNVAAVVQIQWQVEEVESAFVLAVNALQHHFLRVLVGDVADHDRSARVLAPQYAIQVDNELRVGLLSV